MGPSASASTTDIRDSSPFAWTFLRADSKEVWSTSVPMNDHAGSSAHPRRGYIAEAPVPL
jgi:hypothetical protein